MATRRLTISYFEGVNSYVNHNVGKPQELQLVENVRSNQIGSIEKRDGYSLLGDKVSAVKNYGLEYFNDDVNDSQGLYRVVDDSSTIGIRYLKDNGNWSSALAGKGQGLSDANYDFQVAERKLFIVNGKDNNRYIKDNGTVEDSSNTTGDLYNSPSLARKVAYYKERLYLADYDVGSDRQNNAFMWSSPPLGVVGLVEGDYSAGSTEIDVTDTKYIHSSDSIDVYRGGTKIETLNVTDKGESTITVSSTSNKINSADELWVANTHDGDKVFRWPSDPDTTSDKAKRLNTQRLTSGKGETITLFTTVGNVLLVGNRFSLATWNEQNINFFDSNVGCVGEDAWVVNKNRLFFLDYTGVYMTAGKTPQLISSKINDIFNGAQASNLESATAGKYKLSVFFAIGDVTLTNDDGSSGRTLNDVLVEYNIRQQNWFIHTGVPAQSMQRYVTSSSPDNLAFGNNSDEEIYQFLDGNTDNGDEIPFMAATKDFTLMQNEFEKYAYPKKIVVEVERGNNLQCFLSLDKGPYYTVQGEASKGTATFEVQPPPTQTDDQEARCKKLSVAFKEMSDRKCKISRMAIEFRDSDERDENVVYVNN